MDIVGSILRYVFGKVARDAKWCGKLEAICTVHHERFLLKNRCAQWIDVHLNTACDLHTPTVISKHI